MLTNGKRELKIPEHIMRKACLENLAYTTQNEYKKKGGRE